MIPAAVGRMLRRSDIADGPPGAPRSYVQVVEHAGPDGARWVLDWSDHGSTGSEDHPDREDVEAAYKRYVRELTGSP